MCFIFNVFLFNELFTLLKSGSKLDFFGRNYFSKNLFDKIISMKIFSCYALKKELEFFIGKYKNQNYYNNNSKNINNIIANFSWYFILMKIISLNTF